VTRVLPDARQLRQNVFLAAFHLFAKTHAVKDEQARDPHPGVVQGGFSDDVRHDAGRRVRGEGADVEDFVQVGGVIGVRHGCMRI